MTSRYLSRLLALLLAAVLTIALLCPVFAAEAAMAETEAAAKTADIGILLALVSLVSSFTVIGILRKKKKP